MSTCETWPSKWFGYWKEENDPLESAPSIQGFIDPEFKYEDQFRLFTYLAGSTPVLISGAFEKCIFSGCDTFISDPWNRWMEWKLVTDGTWLWPSHLAHYVFKHAVRLPDQMLEHIERNNTEIVKLPDNFRDNGLLALDWPFEPLNLTEFRGKRRSEG